MYPSPSFIGLDQNKTAYLQRRQHLIPKKTPMAHQKNLKLRGTFENVIFYTSNEHFLIRSKPSIVRQTTATKQAASFFGKAVKMSASFRASMKSILPNSKDRNMIHRLDSAMRNWLRADRSATSDNESAVPFISGFEFNLQSLLSERFKVNLTIGKSDLDFITLKIPAFVPSEKIVAPAHTSSVRWKIIAATYDSNNHTFIRTGSKEILIPYSSSEVAAQQIEFDLKPKAGDLCMAVIALNYYTSADGTTGFNDSMKWKPAAIAQAIIF